jgi:hypothetical protein
MAEPTLRSIAKSLDIHIKDDHLVHGETNKKLDQLSAQVAPLDSIRKWLFRGIGMVLTGIVVSFAVQTYQNWNAHQQAAQAALEAATAVKNTPTPVEQAILKKLNALQPGQ